jgi:hypothetical protein
MSLIRSSWSLRLLPLSTNGERSAQWRSSSSTVLALAMICSLALSGCSLSSLSVSSPSNATPTVVPTRNQAVSPVVREVAQTTQLIGANTGPATVVCPANAIALSGGWKIASQGVHVFAAKFNGNMWSVYASHTVSMKITVPIVITVYVECLENAVGASMTTKSFSLTMNPHADGGQALNCDSQELPVGSGFDFGDASNDVELQENTPFPDGPLDNDVSWLFLIENHDSVAHSLYQLSETTSDAALTVACDLNIVRGGEAYSQYFAHEVGDSATWT